MKKSIFAIIVMIFALTAIFSVSASAEESDVPEYINEGGLSYYIQDGEAHIVKLLDTSITEIAIPATVQNYPVVSIKEVFRDNRTITKVTLPEGLRVIDDYAFYNCILQSINIPSTLIKIGDYAFRGCANLEKITIAADSRLTSIGSSAFSYCYNLTEFTIPASVITIGDNAFYACIGITSMSLEPGSRLESIGSGAFSRCREMTDFTIPASVSSIGGMAFGECYNLKIEVTDGNDHYKTIDGHLYSFDGMEFIQYINNLNTNFSLSNEVTKIADGAFYRAWISTITIPQSVTSIGDYAFSESELKNIYFESNSLLTNIGSGAFSECTHLASIDIPEGVTSIGEAAFDRCESLSNVNIPGGVKNIYANTFYNCDELKILLIPQSVQSIGQYAIPSTAVLVVYENTYAHNYAIENEYMYFIYDGVNMPEIYTENSLTYMIYAGEAYLIKLSDMSITEIEIPAQVKSYPIVSILGAFQHNETIIKVILPEGLKVIDDYAFFYCQNLEYINLPSTLTKIGDNAFQNSYNSSTLVIPAGVTSIGRGAFGGNWNLESVSFEACSQLTSIGAYAFSSCINLKNVTIPASVTYIGNSAFESNQALTEIRVLEGNKYYKTIDGSLYNLDGTHLIQYACGRPVSTFAIPEGVTTIADYAFFGCIELTSVIIPQSVTYIGECAFYWCAYIHSISFAKDSKLTTIGPGAFSLCMSLKSIEIPEGVTSVGVSAFEYCIEMTSATIPGSVQYIGEATFHYCQMLEHVIIKNGVKEIASNAFIECPNLRHLLLPESINNIDTNAFSNHTVFIVYEDSCAHRFALNNSCLYFIPRNIAEVFGTSVSGKISYSNGSAVAGATVQCYYNDGVLLGKVTTDADGNYSFAYVELGDYTIIATDTNGASATTNISVKRINAYMVYVSGQPNLTIKNSYTVSGSASNAPTSFAISDTNGNIIASIESYDGNFEFTSIPNGTYIINAYTDSGFGQAEFTVFNGDTRNIYIEIISEFVTIIGETEILNRDSSTSVRGWIDVKLYSSDGNVIATAKTDANGGYIFRGVPCDNYYVVAKLLEIRPDTVYGYNRAYELSGYAFIEVNEIGKHSAGKIVLIEGSSGKNTIEGKITAQGESAKNSKVSLTDTNGNEIANLTTNPNGVFKFINIPNGIYHITATTQSYGMATVTIFACNGDIYGNTHIFVNKSDKIHNIESRFTADVPNISTKAEAERYRSRIAEEKILYDGLSQKEKFALSESYVTKLMMLVELLSSCETSAPSGVIVSGQSVILGDEITNGNDLSFTLEIDICNPWQKNENGVESGEDHIINTVIDTIGTKEAVQYYEITMSKVSNGQVLSISDVQRDINSTGKFRITIPIPADQRGYSTYTMVHVHNGEVSVLADLDDDPNTITIEVDKFSTFVLVADEVAFSESVPYDPTNEPSDELTDGNNNNNNNNNNNKFETDITENTNDEQPRGFFGIVSAIIKSIWKFILSIFGIK